MITIILMIIFFDKNHKRHNKASKICTHPPLHSDQKWQKITTNFVRQIMPILKKCGIMISMPTSGGGARMICVF